MIVEDLVQTFNPQTMISKIKEIIAALDTLNNNIKTAVPNSVGSAVQPVYSNASGVITACLMNSASDLGLLRITEQSYSENESYVVINDHLLIQWGRTTTPARDVYLTMPKAFKNTTYTVSATKRSGGSGSQTVGVNDYETTRFKYDFCGQGGSAFHTADVMDWVAIGEV